MAKLPDMIDFDLKLPRPPFWMMAALVVLVVLSWLPLVMIGASRVMLSERRPIQMFHDMRDQPRYNTQAATDLFADGRAMRPPVPGAVAWGRDAREADEAMLREDDHYYRGYRLVAGENDEAQAEFFEGLPPQIEPTRELLRRGQERYNIYCFACHGADGYGQGPVHARATELMLRDQGGTVWVQPANLHQFDTDAGVSTFGSEVYPDGRLFHVITAGRGNMPAYGGQIKERDRWAIVAYVRALQISQNVPAAELTAEQRERLEITGD
ncbi:MAG: cytochrome c [Phycisphaeraceae bacterium]